MSLLAPGYFQATSFPKSYWVTDYWAEYGEVLEGKLLTPGYFQNACFAKSYMQEDYWQNYGSGIVIPIPPAREAKSGYVSSIRIKPAFKEEQKDKRFTQILQEDEELLEIITAFVIGNN